MDISQICALTDQDRMEDLLIQEKYLIGSYSSLIPEASCRQLKDVLISNFNSCAENQSELYEKLAQLGWCPARSAPKPEVEAARQKYRQLKQQIAAKTGGC